MALRERVVAFVDEGNSHREAARESEAPCLGAAMLAAAAAGLHGSIEEASSAMSGGGRVYMPDAVEGGRYDRLYGLYKDLYPALRPHFSRLHEVLHDIA